MGVRSLDFLFASYVSDCLLKKLATQKWQPVRTATQEKQLSIAKRSGKGWSSKTQKSHSTTVKHHRQNYTSQG